MITNYQILADSSCDLPFSLARSLGVSYAPLRVQFQGAEYENFLDGDPRSRLDIKASFSISILFYRYGYYMPDCVHSQEL